MYSGLNAADKPVELACQRWGQCLNEFLSLLHWQRRPGIWFQPGSSGAQLHHEHTRSFYQNLGRPCPWSSPPSYSPV